MANVNWFADKVHNLVHRQAQKALEALAYDIRENARQNLQENNRIDTKFLYNSVYASTPHGTSPVHPSGTYTSLKGHGQVRRENAVPVTTGRGAIVGAAAIYALYVELEDSFLFKAIEETVGASDRVLTGLYID